MSFYLSEAYSNLYNPRVESNFDDNLRFIDLMEEEDIEEVVESLVWEVCDYGNSLEESFSILSLAASDSVITEAYEEILSESRSQVMARRAQAAQGLQTQKTRLQGDLRKQARRARVDGAISRVKSAIAGARGGMGRASKALGGAIAKARTDGKARLGQLLRRGIKATGRLMGSAGRAIGKAGQQSSQSGLASRQAGKVGKGGQMSLVLEPTAREKTGGVMSKVGRGLRKAGVSMSRLSKTTSSRMSRDDYEARKAQRSATAKSGVGNAFAPNPSRIPVGARGPKPPLPPKPEARKPIAALPPAGGTTGREMTPRRKEALAKIKKAAEGEAKKGIRFSAPGGIAATKRAHTDIQGQRGRFARKALREYEELLDTILDALVEESYASDYESALNIFLNLSEDMIVEMAGDLLID
jgi:hypothetical protein